MAEQMEAKLASLGLKSPSAAASKSPASPGSRNFRQSSDAAGYLSPNAAALYGGNSEAAAMLAAQRAKLKANRISAPGTLASDHATRNFSGGNLDQVQENRSPNQEVNNMRPKSTDGLASAASKSPRPSGPLDDTLSPITNSGNWSSMVNTPLMPMFGEENNANGQATLDAAAAQLASVGQDGRGVLLDQDVSKYRRKSGNPQGGPGSHSSPMASPNLAAASSPGLWNASQNDFLRQAMAQSSPLPGSGSSGSFNMQMSPNSLAGLQSPSGGLSNPMNMQMMNAMAAMGGLGNMSAAQFLTMQQQILQNQQQIAAMAAGNYQSSSQMLNSSNFRQQTTSGNRGGVMPGSAFQNLTPSVGMQNAVGRSPASNSRTPLPPRSGGGQQSATSATHGEEDVTDLKLLQDIPNWLRVLRLHKYTPNFEHTDWKEIVVMSDKDLEAKGVAALGARRKMLKTFESVREKHNIPHPEGSVTAEAAEKAEGTGEAVQAGSD